MIYELIREKHSPIQSTNSRCKSRRKQGESVLCYSGISESRPFYPTRSDTVVQRCVTGKVVQRLSSSTLRNNLGSPPAYHLRGGRIAGADAHHILPISVIKKHIKRLKDEDEDFFDSTENGIFLPVTNRIREEIPYHNGSHPDYTGHVDLLWQDKRLPPHADTEEREEKFINLISDIRDEIEELGSEGTVYNRKSLDEI